jgi:hypothetical protein
MCCQKTTAFFNTGKEIKMQNTQNFFTEFFDREAQTADRMAKEYVNEQEFTQNMLATAHFCRSAKQQLEQTATADLDYITSMFKNAQLQYNVDVDWLLEVLEQDYERPDLALYVCTNMA